MQHLTVGSDQLAGNLSYQRSSRLPANLYSLNAGSGAIGVFAIRPADGSLTSLGVVGGLPAGAGLNGIAAD